MEEAKQEPLKITDTQVLRALASPEIKPQQEHAFGAWLRIFYRSLALLMAALVLSTGILISTIATAFIPQEHYFVLGLFKAFCIIASLALITISIVLVFKISSHPAEDARFPKNTLREHF